MLTGPPPKFHGTRDTLDREGRSSEELAEIKTLKAKVRRLEEDNAILKAATVFFAGELDPRNR